MPLGRTVGLIFFGIVLGIGLTVGTYYGVKEYAPDLASRYLASILGEGSSAGGAAESIVPGIDSTMVRGIVQEILSSEQGKAIMWDLVQNQSRETFEAFFREAMKAPEFRQALADALGTFLATPEGKALLRKVASEALTP